MDRNSAACPIEGRGVARQDQAKRKAKKKSRVRRTSGVIQQGDRRIHLMRPGRQPDPGMAKTLVHNLWKKRISTEPSWPSPMAALLPKERNMAIAHQKKMEAEQREELRNRAAMLQAEQQQILHNLPIEQIPSEYLEGARAAELCPPEPCPTRGSRQQRSSRGPAPVATGRRPPTRGTRRSSRSESTLSEQKDKEERAKKQSLKEEEQLLKKLTSKQKQVVDIEMQKLKQEEAALLRNLEIQRQQDARCKRRKDVFKKKPVEKRCTKHGKKVAKTQRGGGHDQKIVKAEKVQDQKLIKEKAEVQRYEKDWLKIEEHEVHQRQRLLDERASKIENLVQNMNADMQDQWQDLQHDLHDEREKLHCDQDYLETIKREQEELDYFEQQEVEMQELDEFERHEREIEEMEEYEPEPGDDDEACERVPPEYQTYNAVDMSSFAQSNPVDMTRNYQPLPPLPYMPEEPISTEDFCIFPGY
ncbi:trichohyalin-like isoform X2 [Leucoraja erinacea]|uniref:trichohyalin-like isoform X2 n=1 Tax=Leucoraja erinaceus TaxID=7782 RepID=UPI002458383D|nr:trichohyalin-like isoform X2 [Leucoraja erinacea]